MTAEEPPSRLKRVRPSEGGCEADLSAHDSQERIGLRRKSLKCFIPGSLRESGLLREMKGAPLSVFCAYLSHVGTSRLAWPSLKSLAASTGYGVNCIKLARRKLVALGLLVPMEQLRPGGRYGRKNFLVVTVAPEKARGTAARRTVAPSTAARTQCQEGRIRSNDLQVGRDTSKSSTASSDSERPIPILPVQKILKSKRQASIEKRLIQKIRAEGESFSEWSKGDHPLDDTLVSEARQAFAAMKFAFDGDDAGVSVNFVIAARSVWLDNRTRDISPGVLCCKVIDCLEQFRKDGEPASFWPPSFQAHRDKLRAQERAAAAQELLAEENL